MIKRNIQQSVLKSILLSPSFAKSETYKKILTYLVECSLKGKLPNEIDIAIQALDKDDTFDPFEDTLVRVHIYKLRKKLEEYYKEEGKNDKIQLTIPKGHYHVVFESASKSNREENEGRKTTLLIRFFVFTILIFLILIFYLWYTNKTIIKTIVSKNSVNESSFIWSDFLTSEFPTILTFGNLYAFNEYQEELNSFRLVRDDKIGSLDDLEAFIGRYALDNENYIESDWDILPKSSLWNLSRIQPIFTINSKPFYWKTSDEIEWEDLKNYNVIYIGHFHNLNNMNEIFPALHFKEYTAAIPKSSLRQIRFYNNEIDTTYTFIHPGSNENKYTKDYVIFSLVPGPQDNICLFVVSFHQIGRMEVIKKIIENSSLNRLYEEITALNGSVPPYFEMLLEVEGYEETALYTHIKHFYEISPSR
ncbi:hypothetical protein HQ585_08150 [candidate division KSB1 bacterium]|nr:hypothetical protein [candidate division KSB1 bacterium]